MLKPQDLLVLLKLNGLPAEETWTYATLADSLGLSASETHAAVQRAAASGLYSPISRRPVPGALTEFVIHGAPYVYHADRGVPTSRGMFTGFAAPPLDGPDEYPYEARYVWPDPDGQASGWSLTPLYGSAPRAAKRDPRLYKRLALLDELRIGRARERNRASELLLSLLRARP